ncbi:MAG: hypothetical protein JJ896_18110 [Rhodothermales bacterium]|nr:hypothetical protein [Rhodothermales bacterium]MBO6781579.1 hypothetical protein [Rhodothermales bacterium]
MGLQRVRPFSGKQYPEAQREAIAALWKWYDVSGSDRATKEDAARVRSGGQPLRVPAMHWRLLEDRCRRLKVDPVPLANRLEATARLRYGDGPVSGAEITPFLDQLVGCVASTYVSLIGMKGSWQRKSASEFAQGLILLEYLQWAPEYARRGMTLFCRKELKQAGITVDDLAGTEPPKGYRALAWKQSIRARDALAGARTLIVELDFLDRLYTKRVWFAALESLYVLDKRDFDVWTEKPSLSPVAKARVGIQSIFGRTAFRSS